MDLSIKMVMLLPLAMSCLAAHTAAPQEDMLRALINPPIDSTSGGSIITTSITTNSNDKTIGELVRTVEQQPMTSVKALEDALTDSVKSQLVTSFANMSPEQVSTITGAANPNELSQLNLMGGINSLVGMIVRQILQALLPRILGQNSAPAPAPAPRPNVGFPMPGGYPPQQPAGGMFGSMGSMFPMNMMVPGMMFNFMENMF